MKVIIIEDNAEELAYLRSLTEKIIPDAFIAAYGDPIQALDGLGQTHFDIALLDVVVPGLNGLEFAMECKSRSPNINLIFTTCHPEYAAEAFRLRASGYLLKPVTEEDLRRELECLRNPVPSNRKSKPYIQTFGNFELFINGSPVSFHRSKSKEILAYLTDRRGAAVTTRELASVLWEDKAFDFKLSKNLSNIIAELVNDLNAVGAGEILGKRRGELFLYSDNVDCDYFRYLQGDEQAVNSFKDEYMSQYPWGEYTLGSLMDY